MTSKNTGLELNEKAGDSGLLNETLAGYTSREIVLFVQRNSGRILEANAVALAAYGYNREELLGLTVNDLCAKEILEPHALQMMGANIHGSFFETVHCRKDGTTFPVEVSTQAATIGDTHMVLSSIRDISKRKQAEEALRASEAKFRSLFENNPDAIFLTIPGGQVTSANPAACALFQMTEEELCRVGWKGVVDPTDPHHSPAREEHTRTSKGKVEATYVRKDGSKFPAEVSSLIVDGGSRSLAILHDISERKQSEELLHRAKKEWEWTFDSVSDLIIILDNQHEIIRVNEAMARRLGVKSDACVGLHCYEIFHGTPVPSGSCESCPYSRTLADGREHVEEVNMERLGGYFRVTTTPLLSEKGEHLGTVHVAHDITDRKRAEEQLLAMNANLERKVELRTRELQETQKQYLHAEKLSAIGKLSASIAHEFNNPLQGIMSILKGLRKRAILEEEDRQLLDAAINESDRIKDLIHSLQDFNRPSSDRKVPMDVHETLGSLLLLHKSDFRNKRISVVLDYAENLPQILAVRDQIKQVFLNLLTNAADACPQAGGVITISTRQEHDRVAVAIKDTGVGIKPEEMELIFQPFYTTKPEVKGTGLGLSVSYGIIKHHQGEIRVESQPGEGATFTVLLPVKAGEDAAFETNGLPAGN